MHCVKSVRIQGFSGPYFPAFGLNMERYSVSLRIQSECGKMRTRKTPNTDTFHVAVGEGKGVLKTLSTIYVGTFYKMPTAKIRELFSEIVLPKMFGDVQNTPLLKVGGSECCLSVN